MDNFTDNPETAAFVHLHNSGHHLWRKADLLTDPDVILTKEEHEESVDILCECVRKQHPSSKDVKNVLEKFFLRGELDRLQKVSCVVISSLESAGMQSCLCALAAVSGKLTVI